MRLVYNTVFQASNQNRKAYILSRCFFMYSRNFCVTLFELFTMSNFGSSLFLFTINFNCKFCSDFKRNVKLFLNVDLEHADQDEQRKLLRPFRLMPLKHRLFVLFVKLVYHIFNDQAAVVILSLIFLIQRWFFTWSLDCLISSMIR